MYRYYLLMDHLYRVNTRGEVEIYYRWNKHYEGWGPSGLFKDELALREMGAQVCNRDGEVNQPEPV